MKFWLISGVIVLISLGALVYVIGMVLSERHTARAERTINLPPDEVAAHIRTVDRYPEWRSNLDRVEVIARNDSAVRYREHGGDPILFDLVELEPDQLFRSTIADPDLPFGGTWTIQIAAAGDGSRVTIEENGIVRDPLYRFISKIVIGHDSSINRYLSDLERLDGTGRRAYPN